MLEKKLVNNLRQIISYAPTLSSREVGLDGIFFEYHRQSKLEAFEHEHLFHKLIFFHQKHPVIVELLLDGYLKREQVVAGDSFLIPAKTIHSIHLKKKLNFLYLLSNLL
jgi:mannose-6-phosphate isomerase class I